MDEVAHLRAKARCTRRRTRPSRRGVLRFGAAAAFPHQPTPFRKEVLAMSDQPAVQAGGALVGYQTTRFNALRHGVLSQYTVLPWEDETEYRRLIEALIA